MKTLNLVYSNKSDIQYKISQFPDGQQQVTILSNVYEQGNFKKISENTTTSETILRSIQIKSRLNNFSDLELIICAVKSLRNLGVKEIHLYTPYFLGSRSDRQFENGSNNYLKDIICPIINSLNFESVTVIDPHSDVLEACLNNYKKINNHAIVCSALANFAPNKDMIAKEYAKEHCILVSPDSGATKKVFKIAEELDCRENVITCTKQRSVEGNLSNIYVPYHQSFINKDLIIIDDICDGGATFINIARRVKEINKSTKIYLIVTHGIFSKGFEELAKYFDGIYCTNSYKDIPQDYEFGTGSGLWLPDIVKQLNVF